MSALSINTLLLGRGQKSFLMYKGLGIEQMIDSPLQYLVLALISIAERMMRTCSAVRSEKATVH